MVPADSFSPNVLDVQGVDKSGEFIAKCGQNDFYIRYAEFDLSVVKDLARINP